MASLNNFSGSKLSLVVGYQAWDGKGRVYEPEGKDDSRHSLGGLVCIRRTHSRKVVCVSRN